MTVYWFNNKAYCGICYRKIVTEKERKPDHALDGKWFYRMFRDQAVKCAQCDVSMEYRNLYPTTADSLWEYGDEEDFTD